MNRKMLAVAGVAAVFGALNFASRAQSGQSPQPYYKSLVSPPTCMQPQWPREALRYEIDGTAIVRFEIGLDGKVIHPAVTQSSGWKILDDAAVHGLSQCLFQANLDEAKSGRQLPLKFVWSFSDAPAARPLLVADSCPPSTRFAHFSQSDRRASGGDGVLLRFIVNGEGTPQRIVAEPGAQQEVADAAVQYLQGCRFAHDAGVTGPRTDTAYGRVQLQ